MIRFIGDVHGETKEYLQLIRKTDHSVQVGDMGLGFRGVTLPVLDTHKFIRGNHDSPKLCREHPNHLGDYGICHINGRSILYVAGGFSLDQKFRLPGVTWWQEEELSYEDLQKAVDLAEGKQIDIVVSHEAPAAIVQLMLPHSPIGTRTSQGLEALRRVVNPKMWVFGHYHMRFYKTVNGCNFVGLDTLEYIDA